jgi:hypothetical protein
MASAFDTMRVTNSPQMRLTLFGELTEANQPNPDT